MSRLLVFIKTPGIDLETCIELKPSARSQASESERYKIAIEKGIYISYGCTETENGATIVIGPEVLRTSIVRFLYKEE